MEQSFIPLCRKQFLQFVLVTQTISVSHCKVTTYSKGEICDLQARIDSGCSLQQTTIVRSTLECSFKCSDDSMCYGFSTIESSTNNCFLHYHCPQIIGCLLANHDHSYMSKSKDDLCRNGGTYNSQTASCQCVDLWVGKSCDERPRDCGELAVYGYPAGKKHLTPLDPDKDGKNFVNVICVLGVDPNFHILLLLNHNGTVNFNMTWEEFRHGYFIDENNFWFGLDALHAVTSLLQYNVLMLTAAFGDEGVLYRRYDNFVVESEESNFKYTCGVGYDNGRGNVLSSGFLVDDCFGPHQNTSFSTWDRDNDQDKNDNCAATLGTGWWFNSCTSSCRLFGWNWDYSDSKPHDQLVSIPGINFSKNFNFKSIGFYVQKN